MRVANVAFCSSLVVALTLGVATGGSAQGPNSGASDLRLLKAEKVDLKAALTYETMAVGSASDRDYGKARDQLEGASRAINHMEDAVYELIPDRPFASDYDQSFGKVDPWTKFKDDWERLSMLSYTERREYRDARELAGTVDRAESLKREMIKFVSAAIRDKCTELVNLRGPFKVNGVPQGHSEVTVSVSCEDDIDQLDLVIPNVLWTQADAGSDPAAIKDGGKLLEVDTKDAKSVSVTAEGSPDPASGDSVEGEVIPIAGDSNPPFDETM